MLEFFQIAVAATTTTTTDHCNGLGPIILFVKNGIFPLIQIGIPIILIVMGSIDLGKAVISSDDKEIKGATGKLVKRAIAAVAVFFVTTLVTLLLGMFGTSKSGVTTGTWAECWGNPSGEEKKTE